MMRQSTDAFVLHVFGVDVQLFRNNAAVSEAAWQAAGDPQVFDNRSERLPVTVDRFFQAVTRGNAMDVTDQLDFKREQQHFLLRQINT